MSAPPRRSSRLSSVPAAPPAAAASPPSPQTGDKRRAAGSADSSAAASSARANQQHAASTMSDVIDSAASAPSPSLAAAAPAASAATAAAAAAAASAPASAAASAPVAAAAFSSVGARKRHKQTTDAASVVSSAAAPPAAPPSRWSGLYSDALHSILGFASLSELSRVLAVSHRWSDAVTTMPPIHATNEMGDTFDYDRLDPIRAVRSLQLTDFPALRSRLARHVSSFGDSRYVPSVVCLEAVAQHMPWMRSLTIRLDVHPNEAPLRLVGALGRFRSLTSLDVPFGYQQGTWDVSAFNSVIVFIGRLPVLERVTFGLPPLVVPLLSFAPLIALQRLHSLSVRSPHPERPSYSDSQIAEFRSMRSLQKLHVDSKDAFYVHALQPGHALQLTELPHGTNVTESLAQLLGAVPTLTKLHVWLQCPNVSFFSQLPHLTDVEIYLRNADVAVDPDELTHALSHCTKLRTLSVSQIHLTSSHLVQLLPRFPQLTELHLQLCSAVDSLRCFDTPALSASLTNLSLDMMYRCPSSEVVHLLNLRNLRVLLVRELADPVSADLRAQFAVPSARFPLLLREIPPKVYVL